MPLTATAPYMPVPAQLKTESYTYKEVLSNALSYFKGDDLAATTWLNKYALRNAEGDLIEKSPTDMHQRMAREFARIERSYRALPPKKKELLSTYGRKRK